MIRSSKLTIKFSNVNKLNLISLFIDEYKKIVSLFVDLLWDLDKFPKLLPNNITNQIKSQTWLSARIIQCAGKQAAGIVKGTRKKQKNRQYVYDQLIEKGYFKKARKLKVIMDKYKISKPSIKNMNPELDSRFIKMDFNNKTSFDGWITLFCLGNSLNIIIPVKKSKHFNNMQGIMKKGVRLNKKYLTFMFEEEIVKKTDGIILGLDKGSSTCCTLSNGQITKKDNHGWDLSSIEDKMARKKKGSKAFQKCKQHRKNYIGWSINQLNFNGVKTLRIENLKNLPRSSRKLSHWTHAEIDMKLEQTCEKLGVQVDHVNPTYTSQRCSSCGFVRKGSRNGKQFKCKSCGFTIDADLNASINISLDLRPIGRKERLLHKNKTGFYWNEVRQESIVPVANKE